MKKLLIVLTAGGVMACGNTINENHEAEIPAKEASIYPVSAFIAEQVHLVDSFQFPIIKYITVDGITDSGSIPVNEFILLAKEFTEPDISQAPLNKHYKESSFADQSVPNITLTYSTKNPELEIKRLDINIRPDPVQSDQVSSLYIEKVMAKNDSLVEKKLFWKANKNFQIVSQVHVGQNPTKVSTLKVVWGKTD